MTQMSIPNNHNSPLAGLAVVRWLIISPGQYAEPRRFANSPAMRQTVKTFSSSYPEISIQSNSHFNLGSLGPNVKCFEPRAWPDR